MIFSFGHSEHEFLEVDVLGYERAPVGEYWDDNWLTSRIRVHAGGFYGKFDTSILTSELIELLTSLRPLDQLACGGAEFTTLENQLHLNFSLDETGHCTLLGVVYDQPGIGNRLCFELHFDQTLLSKSIQEIESTVNAFPVRDRKIDS